MIIAVTEWHYVIIVNDGDIALCLDQVYFTFGWSTKLIGPWSINYNPTWIIYDAKQSSNLCFHFIIFQIGWYNAKVADVFHLPYVDDTLAYVIVSKPDMFENAFLSYLTHVDCTTARDPLDQCMMHHFQKIKEVTIFSSFEILYMANHGHNFYGYIIHVFADLSADNWWTESIYLR